MDQPEISIFISYRRDDARASAGRLQDHLEAHGAGKVWRDVGGIDPGVPWQKAIDDVVEKCDVVLLLIGPRWLEVTNEGGRRIDQEEDVHRQEIERAMARGALLVPVLIDGADMPRAKDLPIGLAGLPGLQAFRLSDKNFLVETRQLLDAVIRQISTIKARDSAPLKKSAPLPGRAIYERFLQRKDPPTLMGRKGGLRGRLLDEDIATGRWATQEYQVSYSSVDKPPRNWFLPEDFCRRIDQWNVGDSGRVDAKLPTDHSSAAAHDVGQGNFADQLRALGLRGILITAAEQGILTNLACAMDECLCPGGRGHFDQKSHPPTDWAPSADHYPVMEKDGGQLVLGNVRLAHVLCNRVDYAKRRGKTYAKDLARAAEAALHWAQDPETGEPSLQ